MENIKKIMLSLENDNKIKRMVVVGDNLLARYSNKNLSNDELMSFYTKYVNILKENYKHELTGLNIQEQVNKLRDLGIIERNEDLLISNITEYDNPIKYIITYEDGTKEVVIYLKLIMNQKKNLLILMNMMML